MIIVINKTPGEFNFNSYFRLVDILKECINENVVVMDKVTFKYALDSYNFRKSFSKDRISIRRMVKKC